MDSPLQELRVKLAAMEERNLRLLEELQRLQGRIGAIHRMSGSTNLIHSLGVISQAIWAKQMSEVDSDDEESSEESEESSSEEDEESEEEGGRKRKREE